MEIFNLVLLNSILLLFPLIMYLFYVAHNRNIKKRENDLILGLALFSSMYLLIKFGTGYSSEEIVLLINIPIIIGYIKNRKLEAVILSMVAIFYYTNINNHNIVLLGLEYLFYFLLALVKDKKIIGINDYLFGSLFIGLKIIMSVTNVFLTTSKFIFSLSTFVDFIMSYIIMIFIIFILKKGDDIIKYHMTFKELEKEKQIRLSLFKITHEIKNPLAVCKGYLDMLDTNNKDQCHRYIPIIREEINRTLLLLQDFLSVNKVKLDIDIIDINLLLEEACKSLETLLKERNIELEFNDEEEIYINGDYNRLMQVLINVLKNSVEALESSVNGYIKINSNINKNSVIINIEDNGSGISKDNLSKIREPFFTTKRQGTGLGVSLSYEIIQAHHGKIEYVSEENKGTLVTIKIPLMD